MPLASDQEGPAPPELSASSGFVVGTLLCNPKRPNFPSRLHGCCSEFGFCRDHILRFPKRPNFTHRLCSRCLGGTGRACCSGPRRSSFHQQRPWTAVTASHCFVTLCFCKPWRPSFHQRTAVDLGVLSMGTTVSDTLLSSWPSLHQKTL